MIQPGISAEAAQKEETMTEGSMIQEHPETIEITELSQIMAADKAAEMKILPDADTETLMTYEAGVLVLVTGETTDGWYRVTYQDKNGYVRKDLLSKQEIDVTGLDKEMAVNAEEAKFVVEEVERYRAEAKRSKIWGSIMIALVTGIFAVGIFSSMKGEKNGGEKRKKHIKIEDWNGG